MISGDLNGFGRARRLILSSNGENTALAWRCEDPAGDGVLGVLSELTMGRRAGRFGDVLKDIEDADLNVAVVGSTGVS